MKEIAVVANDKAYSAYMAENLEVFFADCAKFNCYGTEEIRGLQQIEEEYVVLSAFTIFQQVKEKVKVQTQIVIVDLTLNKSTLGRLHRIPSDTKVLLANIDYRSCMEVITMIYGSGFKSLELIPYYPGCDLDEDIKIAVTPGELSIVPPGINWVVDLGQRLISSNSIYKIAEAIGAEGDPFEGERQRRMAENMVSANPELERILMENSSLSVQLKTILRLVNQGILITDIRGKICLANDTAKNMLKQRTELLTGFNVAEVLPEFNSAASGIAGDGEAEKLIDVSGRKTIVTVSPIEADRQCEGYVITLEYFKEVEDRQHRFRSKIMGCGHSASYTFDQILGNSPCIEETRKIAMRMARSDSSICLYGESGVGKELFAQSIHNYSGRRDKFFVAVNCSALPENLLESELYGYEEGAFSGAKKGGKIGLFELAHGGTLFLDEIGELPMPMQAKLLRTIEERKILKVGGRNLIDVDIRIICATNRDLRKMADDGKFRRDLYYRLCVLPIYIPPLRQRGADIFLLMEKLKANIGADFVLTEAARDRIRQYSWPGNVRELKNMTEYLANLDKRLIEAEDLYPFCLEASGQMAERGFADGRQNKGVLFVLEKLEEGERTRSHLGRQALARKAEEEGRFITEQEIRRLLYRLNQEGYILSCRGRKGSLLTEEGRRLLQEMRNR